MILGAHTSISGGLHKAIDRGRDLKCQTIQIFTKNPNQWKSCEISDSKITVFTEKIKSTEIFPVIAHNSYLVNLASPDPDIYDKSINAFEEEIDRAVQLGIPYLVFHPGAHKESGEAKGIKKIARALNHILSHRKKKT